MANLKVLDGNAAAKYLSTDGAGTDADPHVSHHVLDANTDGVYIGDIKFGESLLLAANSGVDIGDVTINNTVGSGVYVRPGTSATWDVSDRAARLVGQVYGSQSTVLQQKVTTNDLIVTLDGETVSVTESSPISGFATSAKQLADGHNVTVDNAAGAAAVNIQDGGNTITVDGTVAATQSGTWDVGTVTTITNPVAIKNAAADTVTGISGTYDTIDVSLTNGTYRATIDSSGYLTTNINGTITVDGSVTADTELPAAGALGDAMNNPTTPLLGACLMGWDSVAGKWERCKTDASNYLKVDASVATVTVTGDAAGSLTVDQATAANLKATVYGAGSAGSADAGVVTIQGIASMTPILATLQASDGTDIGNVDVASVVPGTGASNLGKAEDAAHTSGDVGVMMLAVRKDDVGTLAGADGDYVPLIINEHGILRTQAQQHLHIDEMNATTGWTVLGTDTVNLATTTNHVFNTLALEFDKVDGAANTVFAGIQKTLSSTNLAPYGKGGGFFLWSIYLSSLTDVAYVFLRLGTDSSNYNEWRIDDDELAIGWNPLRMGIFGPAVVVANGWDTTAVTYVALGVAFDDEADELADIAADHLSVNTGLQTSADIVAEVSSSVRTPNVNMLKVGNKSVDIGTGNAGVGTMRVVLASDQPVVSIDDNSSSLSIDIGGQAPQLDDTDKIAVSLYGKGTSAGDDAVETDGSGNLQVVGTGTAGSAAGGILTVQGVGSMTPFLATLQASDGTDIGNVDIASASFEKAEDAGHTNADIGVMALAVRHDTISSLCGTDLDYTPLQVDATGYLYTKDKNAASLAVVGGGAESTALRVTIANDSTGVLTVDDGGGSLTVDGTVTATPSGIQEIEGDEAESSGNLPQPVLIGGDDGTDIKNINVDATTGDVQVDVTNQVDAGGATPVITNASDTGAIATSYAPSAHFWLDSITLHLSAAGTTSEAFTITLNATDGGTYDTLLFSQDLSKGAVTDLVWVPEGGPMLFENSDSIDAAWNNAEGRTYGLRIAARLA